MNKETAEKLDAALPVLAAKIEDITGAIVTLQGNVVKGWDGRYSYRFESNDLASQLCGVSKPIFRTIKITNGGGNFTTDNNKLIWFSPTINYSHYGGGRNGTNYIWEVLFFDVEKNEWDFERSKLLIDY